MTSIYYAHVRTSENDDPVAYQSVKEHLEGTANRCANFADDFESRSSGMYAGLTHDMGKCTAAFQKRLLENGPIVDHATAGAIYCAMHQQDLLAGCVAGHHSGLPDFGNGADSVEASTLYGRVKKGINKKYLELCGESGVTYPEVKPVQFTDNLEASYWIRMMYSCLVDADFLDTEEFMNGNVGRGGADSLPILLKRLEKYIGKWEKPSSELDKLRGEILQACIEAGEGEQGIYTLTVPTGGGKTVSSLAFSLHHAVAHGMKRVIYVVPYTSIIEQNAEVFREIVGTGNVLEHHSGVSFEITENSTENDIRKAFASENWDMPIVVTTAVQFFESLYANRSSKCRKLHNLANSVIVFDEAQMIPIPHLAPCVAGMASLVEQFHSTVVLCTATQPSLNDLILQYAPKHKVKEICPNTKQMYEKFKRVHFEKLGKVEDEVLAEQLITQKQVLCIVNSRKAAQKIYSLLPEDGSFHLSTLLVPAQRQKIFEKIRKRLEDGKMCRVVSTSLIEAGVDVDFPTVYRELAGLDSILQAAGRCNRNGKKNVEESAVVIFERTDKAMKMLETEIGATKEALEKFEDPGNYEAIHAYFQSLRSFKGDAIDKDGIIKAFQEGISGCALPFRKVAEKFHFIDQNTWTVYIPWQEGKALIGKLESGECSKELYRQLGRYSVSVYEQHYQALYDAGALLTAREIPYLDDTSVILNDMKLYNDKIGLCLKPEMGQANFV